MQARPMAEVNPISSTFSVTKTQIGSYPDTFLEYADVNSPISDECRLSGKNRSSVFLEIYRMVGLVRLNGICNPKSGSVLRYEG